MHTFYLELYYVSLVTIIWGMFSSENKKLQNCSSACQTDRAALLCSTYVALAVEPYLHSILQLKQLFLTCHFELALTCGCGVCLTLLYSVKSVKPSMEKKSSKKLTVMPANNSAWQCAMLSVLESVSLLKNSVRVYKGRFCLTPHGHSSCALLKRCYVE